MNGWTGVRRYNRKAKFIKIDKGQEVVESYGRLLPDGTWHMAQEGDMVIQYILIYLFGLKCSSVF